MIDLHIHSTASDGSVSPQEILSMACRLKLNAISITDHDTLEGSKQAIESGIPDKLRFIQGVELSASRPGMISGRGSFHILGYGINIDDPDLNQELSILQKGRRERIPKIIGRLRQRGFNLSEDEVSMKTKGPVSPGRPHVAQVMLEKGFVRSINEAFDKYLTNGKPAYVDKLRVHYTKAVSMILDAGGLPVLAHPGILYNSEDRNELDRLIAVLKELGLKGIEAYYPRHSHRYTKDIISIADKYGLFVTGGTDFHGDLKPAVKMGTGRGNFYVPSELYDNIISSLKAE